MAILMNRYDTEFLEWDPITVNLQIRTDFGFEPNEMLQDKINAGSSILTTNLFHLSLEAFNTICNTLNFGVATSEIFLPADLDDVLWGVTEAYMLEGPELRDTVFSHNVGRYVGVLLSEAGIQKPPSVLQFAEYPEGEQLLTHSETLDSDEPMFRAFWDKQQSERDELETINKNKLYALFNQLDSLPIKVNQDFTGKSLDKLKSELQTAQP
jgi:hypothetical protein